MAALNPPAAVVQGADGFGNVDAPAPAGRALAGTSAATFLSETCAASPGEVTVIALGPLTNVAAAIAQVGLHLIVTSQYSSTALHQVSYHIQSLFS